jgi:hypothetical protein
MATALPHHATDAAFARSAALSDGTAVDLIKSVCRLAGSLSLIDAVRAEIRDQGVARGSPPRIASSIAIGRPTLQP